MEVTRLEGMNRELSPPEGWDKEKHGECSPLPVFAEVVAGNVTMTSAWKPNAEELAHLVRGAAVALVVYGTVHPPVAIGVFPAEQEVLDGAVEKLRAVLCGSEGQVNIEGSDEDRAIVGRALAQLELEAQNRPQPAGGEAVGTVISVPADEFSPAQIGWHRDIPPVGTKLYATPPAAQVQQEACPFCGGTGGHWEGCRAPVDTPTHPAAGDKVLEEALTIKVDASEVKSITDKLLVKLTPPTGEELIALAPGEYSDWEKRIWRRGYQAAVTAMREAVASADSGQG